MIATASADAPLPTGHRHFDGFGILFVLPLFLESVLGFSALHTGVVLLAVALGTLVAGGVTPELARAVGARGVARLGLAFEVVGLVGLGVAETARHVAAMVRTSGGAAIHPLTTLPHGADLVVATSGTVADATRFVALIGAGFIAVGLLATVLLPKTAGSAEDPPGEHRGRGQAAVGGAPDLGTSPTSRPDVPAQRVAPTTGPAG